MMFPSPSGASILIRNVLEGKVELIMFPSPSGASILILASMVLIRLHGMNSFHLLPEHQFLFSKVYKQSEYTEEFPSPSGASILILRSLKTMTVKMLTFPSPSGASILIPWRRECKRVGIDCFHLLPEHQFLFHNRIDYKTMASWFPSPSGASILIQT